VAAGHLGFAEDFLSRENNPGHDPWLVSVTDAVPSSAESLSSSTWHLLLVVVLKDTLSSKLFSMPVTKIDKE
jgi:hypothetical protein